MALPTRSMAKQALLRRFQRLSARWRVLPDFLIVGAQKAGTTSLFHYLQQHPQIRMSSQKEVHFFDYHYDKGELWYRSWLPLRATIAADMRVGQSSPNYLFHPHAPKRIHGMLPSARLLVVLRNPVDRAVSHYHHEVRLGREPLPIVEAFMKEEERTKPAWRGLMADEFYYSRAFQHHSYKQRGIYITQIERFLRYFDRSQIFFLNSDQLLVEPKAVLESVCGFLGVEPDCTGINFQPRNVGSYRRELPRELADYLNEYFLPHNRKLQGLLGPGFAWPEESNGGN